MAMSSVSAWAIVPMQDVLSLGTEARMNRPSAAYGNWSWRMAPHYYHNQTAERLAELAVLFDRV